MPKNLLELKKLYKSVEDINEISINLLKYHGAKHYDQMKKYLDIFSDNEIDLTVHIFYKHFTKDILKRYAEPFFTYCLETYQFEDLFKKAWFRQFVMLAPNFAVLLNNFIKNNKNVTNKDKSSVQTLLSAYNAKILAHSFGSFVTKVSFNGYKLILERISPNLIQNLIPKKIGIKENSRIKNIEVVTKFPDVNGNYTQLHNTSFSIYQGKKHCLIGVGNRGAGAEFRGVKIYKIKDINQASDLVKLLEGTSENNTPLVHSKYLQILSNIKKELIVEIPIMEQLHGYCGMISAVELNLFSHQFFQLFENELDKKTDTKKETIIDLDTLVNRTIYFQLRLMCQLREHLGRNFMSSASKEFVTENKSFIQEIYRQANRLSLSDNFIKELETYMLENDIIINRQNDQYLDYLKKRHLHNSLQPHEVNIVRQQHDNLVYLYKRLNDQYSPFQLEKMDDLDRKLSDCCSHGLKYAQQMYNDRFIDKTLNTCGFIERKEVRRQEQQCSIADNNGAPKSLTMNNKSLQ